MAAKSYVYLHLEMFMLVNYNDLLGGDTKDFRDPEIMKTHN